MFIIFQIKVKKMNEDGTVEQEKTFDYGSYLPKYEWVDIALICLAKS